MAETAAAPSRGPQETIDAGAYLAYHLDGGAYHGRYILACNHDQGGPWVQVRADEYQDALAWPLLVQQSQAYYLTANQVAGVTRDAGAVFALANLVVDLDCHDPAPAAATPEEAADLLLAVADMPQPTGVVYTGRGLQLWWHIDAVAAACRGPYHAALRGLCEAVQDVLDEYPLMMDGWAVDKAASHALVGLRRMPGSYNHSAGHYGSCVLLHNNTYDLHDLTAWANEAQAEAAQSRRPALVYAPTPMMAAAAAEQRLARLLAWAAGRGWRIVGHRSNFLCVAAAFLVAIDAASVPAKLAAINARLLPPLRPGEVAATARTAMRKQYRYRNQTVADLLGMTEAEAAAWGAGGAPGPVLGKTGAWMLAQQTGKDTRRPNRTRDKTRAAARAAKLAALAACKASGRSQAQTVDAMAAQGCKVSLRWVKQHWHDMDD